MEIVLAQQISGTYGGQDWPPPGTKLDLPEGEAQGLVQNGSAYLPGDDRVKFIGGHRMSDEMIAGAPTGHDRTEGQPDTNLARANALALDERDTREVTREAAERVDGPSVVKDDDQAEEFGKVETAAIDTTPSGKPVPPKSTRGK
jgi:hypothetical protein